MTDETPARRLTSQPEAKASVEPKSEVDADEEQATRTATKQAKMDADRAKRSSSPGLVTQTLDNALAGGPALQAEKQAARDARK